MDRSQNATLLTSPRRTNDDCTTFLFNNNLQTSCYNSPTPHTEDSTFDSVNSRSPIYDAITHSSKEYYMVTFKNSIILCMRHSKPALYLNQNIIHLPKWKIQLSGNADKVNTSATRGLQKLLKGCLSHSVAFVSFSIVNCSR